MPITKKPTLLKTFRSGLNHQTHLITSIDELAVLKLFSKPSPSAISIQRFAACHQVAPKILYANQTNDVALMAYVDSDNLTQALSYQDISLLGNTLKKLHSLPTELVRNETGDFDLLEYCDIYLANTGTDDSLTRSIHKDILPAINFFLKDTTPWCVCHNDLVNENCFITKAGAQFIDWEYAQFNNPWFDLATIIYALKLDQQQATSLITAYDPQWLGGIATPIYFASQCAMLWCDILWNIARGENLQLPELAKKLADLRLLNTNFNLAL